MSSAVSLTAENSSTRLHSAAAALICAQHDTRTHMGKGALSPAPCAGAPPVALSDCFPPPPTKVRQRRRRQPSQPRISLLLAQRARERESTTRLHRGVPVLEQAAQRLRHLAAERVEPAARREGRKETRSSCRRGSSIRLGRSGGTRALWSALSPPGSWAPARPGCPNRRCTSQVAHEQRERPRPQGEVGWARPSAQTPLECAPAPERLDVAAERQHAQRGGGARARRRAVVQRSLYVPQSHLRARRGRACAAQPLPSATHGQ